MTMGEVYRDRGDVGVGFDASEGKALMIVEDQFQQALVDVNRDRIKWGEWDIVTPKVFRKSPRWPDDHGGIVFQWPPSDKNLIRQVSVFIEYTGFPGLLVITAETALHQDYYNDRYTQPYKEEGVERFPLDGDPDQIRLLLKAAITRAFSWSRSDLTQQREIDVHHNFFTIRSLLPPSLF